ncbi:MAG TPA: type II secretion system protein GspG [Verrucomicrobiae bacterium]|jgi:hypothetical protein|nr:type II secretion system protein GspG [Verrucomicrobiae bacterium]
MPTNKKIAVVLVITALLIMIGYWLLPWPKPNPAPPDSDITTMQNQAELGELCKTYHKLTGDWPKNLWKLSSVMMISNTNIIVDGWGHPFAFRLATNPSTTFWLISYGADGLPGGTRSNSDFIMEMH